MGYQQPATSSKKFYTPQQAQEKISLYCAYQERSHKEVRNKLYSYGLHKADVERILTKLITGGFLNEERFAKAFAGGKFRIKKWGRNKIEHELETFGITAKCIRKGLDEIDEEDYRKTLKDLLTKRLLHSEEVNLFKKKEKIAGFVIGKGYEPALVWEMLKKIAEKE